VKTLSKNRAYWTCQVLGWGAYSIVGVWGAAQQIGWRPALIANYILYFLYSIVLTDQLRREAHRRHWQSASAGRLWGRYLLAAAAIGAIQTLLIAGVDLALEGRASAFMQVSPVLFTGLGTTAVTVIWVVLYVGFTAKRRREEKEAELLLALREAELRALEAQINPHFLFNCLNSIRALVVENPSRAQDMITRLANILRHNLRDHVQHTVPLSSEVDAVSDYLAIESARFDDRLRVRCSVSPDAGSIPVPAMLLQTLVENAVKHGIAPRPAGGDLAIRATIDPGWLKVEVENTGRLATPTVDATRMGLSNVRGRLQILYGDRATLELANREDDRVVATVRIPLPEPA
jgi:two-component system sensor histidine kinase AlgZ